MGYVLELVRTKGNSEAKTLRINRRWSSSLVGPREKVWSEYGEAYEFGRKIMKSVDPDGLGSLRIAIKQSSFSENRFL